MKHIIALAFVILLVGCTHRTVLLRDESPSLTFSDIVKDEELINSAVQSVRQYIARNTRGKGLLVLRSPSGRERRCQVVEVWDLLSRHPDGYTIQVDADEFESVFPRVLFFRLERIGPQFRVTGVEYGPKHLRQTEL